MRNTSTNQNLVPSLGLIKGGNFRLAGTALTVPKIKPPASAGGDID